MRSTDGGKQNAHSDFYDTTATNAMLQVYSVVGLRRIGVLHFIELAGLETPKFFYVLAFFWFKKCFKVFVTVGF